MKIHLEPKGGKKKPKTERELLLEEGRRAYRRELEERLYKRARVGHPLLAQEEV